MAVQLVVGVLPDAAGVEHDHVGVVEAVGGHQAVRFEDAGEPLGVVLVHLAPEGADEVAAGSADGTTVKSRWRRRLRRRVSADGPTAGARTLAAQSSRVMGSSSLGSAPSGISPAVAQADLLADLLGDLDHHFEVLGDEGLGVLPALAELLAFVGVPGTRLLDDAQVHGHVEQGAFPADPLAVHDVELRLG